MFKTNLKESFLEEHKLKVCIEGNILIQNGH